MSTVNHIDRTVAENITAGQLCTLDNDGFVYVAHRETKKAIGMAMNNAAFGELVRLQLFGIVQDYEFSEPVEVGEYYYQDDNGSITASLDLTRGRMYIVAIALDEHTLLLIR